MIKLILAMLFSAQFVFAAADLSEDQIPLKIDAQVKATSTEDSSAKMVVSFAILATMLGAAYYFIRKYSVSNKVGSKSNMQIKILSQHYLGPKKSLAIVRVAGESILIGVTDQNISMIKALSLLDDELPQVLPKNFEDTLTEKSDLISEAEAAEDEFSFAGLKTTVSQKLKSMRSLQ
jgi:flagellar protein FliO/FliZ